MTISQVWTSLSIWLHNIATVILIGHHLLLSLLYIPTLATSHPTMLSEISKRSRPWMYVSLLIFAFTGTYLTFADPNYLGFGNIWSILMLIKHLLILGMIGIGFWFNAVLRVGPMMRSNNGAKQATLHFRLYANLMTISGLLVLLLTALGQVE